MKGAIVINIISVYLISTTVARATLIAAGVWYTYGRESTVGGIVALGYFGDSTSNVGRWNRIVGHSYSEMIHVIAWFLSSDPFRVEQETGGEE